MTAVQLPEPIHRFQGQVGSAVTTRCGRLLELGPHQVYRDINVTLADTEANCPLCRHPSSR